MYLLGLRALGHEVFYIEDTGECVYDPVQNTRATDPSYGTSYIHDALEPFGLGDRWTLRQLRRQLSRRSADDVRRYCADADLFINLSGGSWFWRDEYARHSAQGVHRFRSGVHAARHREGRAVVRGVLPALRSPVHVRREHRHAGVADPGRRVHLAQDLAAGHARRLAQRRSARAIASRRVMTWQIESFTDVGGNKDQEFVKFIDLPSRTPQRFELAINGPQQLLREHGWDTVDAMGVSRTPGDTATSSTARRPSSASPSTPTWSSRSGWFSDRTECYLAVGRPALVQDTGWTRAPAVRRGLLAFSDARRGDRRHRPHQRRLRIATRGGPREIAREHFDADASCCRGCSRTRVRMTSPLRIAHVAPVATTIPPPKSGSVETMTSLLTEGLVARGHDVTLVRHGRFEDAGDAARDLSRTATGTTRTCGRGSCTRC